MLRDEGGVGNGATSRRRFAGALRARAVIFRVLAADFFVAATFFRPPAGVADLADRAFFAVEAALLAGFEAFFTREPRAFAFFDCRVAVLRAELDFRGREVAFDVPLALRLAMFESFRNLDCLAISIVLSDAYRNSDGAAEHLLTEIAGRRTPLPERRHSYG